MCCTSRQASLNITKYNKTRNWAVWNNGELLAVTVYRKGAQAVCDFINNLTPYNTKMNKKANKAAKATQTEQEIIILVETKPNGQRMRASLSHESTSVCYDTKGAWHEDSSYSQPLTELIEQGLLKPANQRARQAIRDFFGEEAKPAAKKATKKGAKKAKAPKAKKEPKAKKPAKAKEDEIIMPNDEPAMAAEHEAAEEVKQERAKAQAAPSARKLICAVVMQGETEPRPIPADIVLKPGMKLIREYKGTTYMVDVKENGFEWDGEVYPTLTHISWQVTPYKQGGPAFFGISAKPRAMKA